MKNLFANLQKKLEPIKTSRWKSFCVVAAIYLAAIALGVLIYLVLPAHFSFWVKLLIADTLATVFVFLFSLFFDNASVYDPYWSVQPPVILTAFVIYYGANLLGIFLLIAVWFWAIRLTANWAYTFQGLSHQDWRYTMLAEKTGKLYPLVNFVGIHFVPTLIVYFCTLPAVHAVREGFEANVFSILFCLFGVLFACLQGVADFQMHTYRKDRKTTFCEKGLWKYARHPNYLGEIGMWWSIGFAVFFSSFAHWYLLCGALLNTLLFIFISIPMADERQAKKEGFAAYKEDTRMLLPIPKFRISVKITVKKK